MRVHRAQLVLQDQQELPVQLDRKDHRAVEVEEHKGLREQPVLPAPQVQLG